MSIICTVVLVGLTVFEIQNFLKWESHAELVIDTSHRDYSAVLYLNENYIGGRTFFLEDDYNVVPKTGKLILFTSGKDHIHGVNEVISGSRYTMALWFTKTRDKLFKIKWLNYIKNIFLGGKKN